MRKDNDNIKYRVVRLEDGSFQTMTEKEASEYESRRKVRNAFQRLQNQQLERDKEMELRRKISNGEIKLEPTAEEKGKEGKRDKRWNMGCFIVMFIFIASGIPLATKGEGPIGSFVIAIIGLIIAYYVAKAISNRD